MLYLGRPISVVVRTVPRLSWAPDEDRNKMENNGGSMLDLSGALHIEIGTFYNKEFGFNRTYLGSPERGGSTQG